MLGTAERRDRLVKILEETRCRYRFVVYGYVALAEHFHLLIREAEVGDPPVVMKVIKERFSKTGARIRRECAERPLMGTERE